MDIIQGTILINPSGLDASVFGSPVLSPGILGQSIEVDGKDRYIKVSGPSHRYECFGDLDKCPKGKSIMFLRQLSILFTPSHCLDVCQDWYHAPIPLNFLVTPHDELI